MNETPSDMMVEIEVTPRKTFPGLTCIYAPELPKHTARYRALMTLKLHLSECGLSTTSRDPESMYSIVWMDSGVKVEFFVKDSEVTTALLFRLASETVFQSVEMK